MTDHIRLRDEFLQMRDNNNHIENEQKTHSLQIHTQTHIHVIDLYLILNKETLVKNKIIIGYLKFSNFNLDLAFG